MPKPIYIEDDLSGWCLREEPEQFWYAVLEDGTDMVHAIIEGEPCGARGNTQIIGTTTVGRDMVKAKFAQALLRGHQRTNGFCGLCTVKRRSDAGSLAGRG
jgi:hypothetical protein